MSVAYWWQRLIIARPQRLDIDVPSPDAERNVILLAETRLLLELRPAPSRPHADARQPTLRSVVRGARYARQPDLMELHPSSSPSSSAAVVTVRLLPVALPTSIAAAAAGRVHGPYVADHPAAYVDADAALTVTRRQCVVMELVMLVLLMVVLLPIVTGAAAVSAGACAVAVGGHHQARGALLGVAKLAEVRMA